MPNSWDGKVIATHSTINFLAEYCSIVRGHAVYAAEHSEAAKGGGGTGRRPAADGLFHQGGLAS